MKRFLKSYNFFAAAGILLAIGFIIGVWADYYEYQSTINSAPFYVFIMARSIEFLLPGIICLIAAICLRKRRLQK